MPTLKVFKVQWEFLTQKQIMIGSQMIKLQMGPQEQKGSAGGGEVTNFREGFLEEVTPILGFVESVGIH